MPIQRSVSRESTSACWLALIFLGSLLTCNLSASAQSDPLSPRVTSQIQRAGSIRKSPEQRKAELLGILIYTNLNIAFEEVPARQAIKELRAALKVNIIGRFSDDSIGHGIDPNAPITFQATDMPALDVLNAIVDQCALYEDCTWQLRSSFVEVGTKRRLAVPGALEVRIYEVRDLLLSVPNFRYDANDIALGATTYVDVRKTADDLAAELLDLIVDVIEPEAWEEKDKEDDVEFDESEDEAPSPKLTDPNQTNPPQTDAEKRLAQYEYDKARHSRKGQWASAKYWQGKLIVRAPDFIHRQLNGYPKPIPPKEYKGRARP